MKSETVGASIGVLVDVGSIDIVARRCASRSWAVEGGEKSVKVKWISMLRQKRARSGRTWNSPSDEVLFARLPSVTGDRLSVADSLPRSALARVRREKRSSLCTGVRL